jgi:predicted RND superfamily exporter protein
MAPHFFEKRDRWGNGLALWIVAGMVFLIPMSLWSLSYIRLENEVHNWIPKDNPEYRAFAWYKDHFPTDDAILFTWEGSSLSDPRTGKLVRKIRGTTTADGRRRGGSKFFTRVRTPHDLLVQMRKNKIPHDEALRRLEGILIGSGPIRLRLTDAGRTRQEKFIEVLCAKAREEMHVELAVTGPATDASGQELTDSAGTEPAEVAATEPADKPAVAEAPAVETTGATDATEPDITADLPAIPPHDLSITWRGMHWNPDQIKAFEALALALRFPATGSATKVSDKPLVEECFQIPGTPIALALYLSEAGHDDRTAAFGWLKEAADEAGIPDTATHMGGSAVAGSALNREVIKSAWDSSAPAYQLHRRSLVLLSGLVGGVLAFWSLRSLRLAGLVLGVSYYTALVSTALVPATGGSMNMVLVVMPTLLFVTTLSVAIHLANYWQHAAAVDPKTAVVESVKTALVPCLWAGLTSAVGQASLMSSSLTPVRDFGLYSAVGTLISLVVTLYGLPALLQILPARPPKAEDLDNVFWHGLAAWVARWHRGVVVASLVITGICTYGLVYFQTETKVIRYFADTTRTVHDYNFIEDNLAGIVPIEVIVRFDREAQQQRKFLERRELVRQIEERMEKLPDISGALSLSDFLPDEPAPGPTATKSKQVKYNATSRTIETRVKNGEQAGARSLLAVANDKTDLNANGDELWRITAQVAIMSKLNYADLRTELDGICMSVLRGTSGNSTEKVPAGAEARLYHPGASHVVTGMIPLFLATQQELLTSFIWSFLGAFGSIALMVMMVLRHPVAGFLAMIPNVLPIGAVFGLISWSGMRVDMGSTVTASIALGITIDGTLHLITWFRIGIQQGKNRAEAVAQALGHCGPAMWQTTLMVSIGLLMLYPAELVLISRFGWLMAVLLGAASVTDLVLTPALLAGPLGYLIQKCTPVTGEVADASTPDSEETLEPVGSVPGKPHLEQRSVRIRRID